MPVLRRIARPLLASMYVVGGVNTLRNSAQHAKVAEPVVSRIADVLPERVPSDVVTLVRIDAAVKVGAGTLLALGKYPRLAALVLAGSLVPTTIAGHPFWQEDDPASRANQQTHFIKNLSMLGGLLIAAGDTAGRPSLGWRARHAADRASHRVQDVASATSSRAHDAASATSTRAHDAAGTVLEALPSR
ncbi:MAG TPA: DoxX family protein [Mycobacteriales bacterium]|jgi:uncharacterized membrane protein YphA (DoxX/SURF4 family)|nr:DoxX family protein [Mycobacteriales bacterium]